MTDNAINSTRDATDNGQMSVSTDNSQMSVSTDNSQMSVSTDNSQMCVSTDNSQMSVSTEESDETQHIASTCLLEDSSTNLFEQVQPCEAAPEAELLSSAPATTPMNLSSSQCIGRKPLPPEQEDSESASTTQHDLEKMEPDQETEAAKTSGYPESQSENEKDDNTQKRDKKNTPANQEDTNRRIKNSDNTLNNGEDDNRQERDDESKPEKNKDKNGQQRDNENKPGKDKYDNGQKQNDKNRPKKGRSDNAPERDNENVLEHPKTGNRLEREEGNKRPQIIVIGKTGSGKSSLCNRMTQTTKYLTGRAFKSITTKSQEETAVLYSHLITVQDTQDISSESKEKRREIVQKWKEAVEGCRCLIVLAVRCDQRYSPAEYDVYRQIRDVWGPDLCRRLVVAFTFGDTREDPEADMRKELGSVWPELKDVLHDARDQYVVFNDKHDEKEDRPRRDLVSALMGVRPVKKTLWETITCLFKRRGKNEVKQ